MHFFVKIKFQFEKYVLFVTLTYEKELSSFREKKMNVHESLIIVLKTMKRTKTKAFFILFWAMVTQADKSSEAPSCPTHAFKKNSANNETHETWITVFVHGIMSIKPHLNVHNFIRFMRDDIGNTVYEKTVEIMCQDSFFCENQAMQGFGLRPIDIDNNSLKRSANTMARIYDEVTKSIEGNHIKNHYYTFGWSALMSPTVRYLDSKKLFEALVKEVAQFKSKGINPKIRVVGYSHGGNVCLNLAAIRQDFYPLSSLSIDELHLIGIPIQTENDYLVGDEIFKKVFNFYSDEDRIQPIDFFAFNRFFSQKTFKSRRQFKVPSNLYQIKLKLMKTMGSKTNKKRWDNRNRLAHNFCDPAIISGSSPLLRNVSPGHIELWFYGWTPQHYRENFILGPLPTFVFIPYITHHLNKDLHLLDYHDVVIADMRPDQETLILKQHGATDYVNIVPFATHTFRNALTDIAFKGKPKTYSKEEYDDHIRQAYEQAVCLKKEEDIACPRPHKATRKRNKKRDTRKKN